MHNKKGNQIDIAILGFSKSFDTVHHDGILGRLKLLDCLINHAVCQGFKQKKLVSYFRM